MTERIAVIGLGYVGLPVAVALGRVFPGTIGFDISASRIAMLREGADRTGEVTADELGQSALTLTTDPAALAGAVLRPGSVVVLESTVYPGVTEEICGSLLGRRSGLRPGVDFGLGYSPERINPGDRAHRLGDIVKVVSASDARTLARLVEVYGAIVPAGLHRAPSIRVAEAAKVIENTQRDLNIALMNELALICERLGIRTGDVLAAAASK